MASDSQLSTTSRVYRSPRRDEQARQTRERIVASAIEHFVTRGYAGTSMRAVAAAAGVSLPTVELVIGTKPQLLKVAIDVAIAGDDEPIPMLEREWAVAARETADPEAYVACFGRALRDAHARSAGVIVAAKEAARADEAIARLARHLSRQRAKTVEWIVDGLCERGSLRSGVTRAMAIDTLYVLMDPVVFQCLTQDRRWTAARFERWFIDSTLRLTLRRSE